MKEIVKKLLVCLIFILTGCGRSLNPTCHVIQTSTGYIESCPDGSSAVVTNGALGSNGADGASGSNGIDGADGSPGAQGPTGPQGLPGLNGRDGINAEPCTVAVVTNGVQISCPDGSTQTILNGTNGTNGSPGTSVTAVQFCTNFTTSYPSTFPEYGFCIGGHLYATYWDRAHLYAFTAEVVPGRYETTSPSAYCTFTVGLNCSIIP